MWSNIVIVKISLCQVRMITIEFFFAQISYNVTENLSFIQDVKRIHGLAKIFLLNTYTIYLFSKLNQRFGKTLTRYVTYFCADEKGNLVNLSSNSEYSHQEASDSNNDQFYKMLIIFFFQEIIPFVTQGPLILVCGPNGVSF